MRMTALAIGGVTVGLAVALAWYVRQEPDLAADGAAVLVPAEPVVNTANRRSAAPDLPADAPPPAEEPPADAVASPAPSQVRGPLRGETAVTPMAQLLADRQRELPPGMVEGEREFAAESIDSRRGRAAVQPIGQLDRPRASLDDGGGRCLRGAEIGCVPVARRLGS